MNRHILKCTDIHEMMLNILVIREIHTKSTMSYQYIPIRIAKIKETDKTSIGEVWTY